MGDMALGAVRSSGTPTVQSIRTQLLGVDGDAQESKSNLQRSIKRKRMKQRAPARHSHPERATARLMPAPNGVRAIIGLGMTMQPAIDIILSALYFKNRGTLNTHIVLQAGQQLHGSRNWEPPLTEPWQHHQCGVYV